MKRYRVILLFTVFSLLFLVYGQISYNNKLTRIEASAYAEFQREEKLELEEQLKERERRNKSLINLKNHSSNDEMKSIEMRKIKSDIFDTLQNEDSATIVFLGDSTTEKNIYTNDKPGHVELIDTALTEIFGDNLHIVNSGISGHTIQDMSNRLDDDVISHNPDLVVINSGINDVGHNVSSEEFKSTYSDVIERIQNETDAEILIRTSNLTMGKETNDLLEKTVNPVVKSLAKEYELGYVDAYSYYEKIVNNDSKGIVKYNYNYSHPNEIGQSVIGDIVMHTLLQDIESK